MELSERSRKIIARLSYIGIGASACYFLVRAAISLILRVRFVFTDSAAIGIIGGADGPTAIFLTSTPRINGTAVAAGLLFLSLCGAILTRKKK